MLLVHGGRDHCRNWDWVAHELKSEYHVIAPDLRGHGDSQWLVGGGYTTLDYVYDIAQLVRQTRLDDMVVIGHSMGGSVSLAFTGLYPEKVRKLVSIEGMGMSPATSDDAIPGHERLLGWVDNLRQLSGRIPKRYPTLEDAFQRMQQAQSAPHRGAGETPDHPRQQSERGRHLQLGSSTTTCAPGHHSACRRGRPSVSTGASPARRSLVHGAESWASDPREDGRLRLLPGGAGGWAWRTPATGCITTASTSSWRSSGTSWTMTRALEALITAIHGSPRRGVLTVTGGGSGLLSGLLGVAGASSTVLEANVPYAARAMRDWLGMEPAQACSDPRRPGHWPCARSAGPSSWTASSGLRSRRR